MIKIHGMKLADLLTLWWLQIKNGDAGKLVHPRTIRMWKVIRDRDGLAGIAYVRNHAKAGNAPMYTLDGYHNRARPPLKPTLIAARELMTTFSNQHPGKKLYCVFRRSRYRILVLMRELGFTYHHREGEKYVFIRRQ